MGAAAGGRSARPAREGRALAAAGDVGLLAALVAGFIGWVAFDWRRSFLAAAF